MHSHKPQALNALFLISKCEFLAVLESLADATDLRVEAQRIAAAESEFVFFTIFQHMDIAAKELEKAGCTGAKGTVLLDETRIEGAGSALHGIVYADYPVLELAFTENSKDRYRKMPSNMAATGYGSVYLLAASFESAVRKAILAVISHKGAGGSLTFDRKGEVQKRPQLLTLAASGQRVLLVGYS